MTKTERYQQMFMKTALLSAEQSFSMRSKVGAILVKDNRIVVNAWNGRVAGANNICETTECDTRSDVVHGEMNAISFAARNGICTDGCDLYVTLSPCPTCALLLIQSGIKAVYYMEKYRNLEGIDILKENGIIVERIGVM